MSWKLQVLAFLVTFLLRLEPDTRWASRHLGPRWKLRGAASTAGWAGQIFTIITALAQFGGAIAQVFEEGNTAAVIASFSLMIPLIFSGGVLAVISSFSHPRLCQPWDYESPFMMVLVLREILMIVVATFGLIAIFSQTAIPVIAGGVLCSTVTLIKAVLHLIAVSILSTGPPGLRLPSRYEPISTQKPLGDLPGDDGSSSEGLLEQHFAQQLARLNMVAPGTTGMDPNQTHPDTQTIQVSLTRGTGKMTTQTSQ